MSEVVPSRPNEIAPSVKALLEQFNEETRQKLALARDDSSPVYEAADGSLIQVEDWWISDADAELDNADAIPIQPTSVVDRKMP